MLNLRKILSSKFFQSVKKKNLVQFYLQLSILIASGFSLLRALNVCIAQTSDGALKEIVEKIQKNIERGASLSQAIESFPRLFTSFHLGMMRTAERSGTLPEILKYLAQYEEKEMKMLQRIRAALAYPVFITAVAIIVIILLTRYLSPLLKAVTTILGEDKIPSITRILIFVGKCTTDIHYIVLIAATVMTASIVLKSVMRSKRIRYLLCRTKLMLPVLGRVYKKVILIRICRVMATLLSAGVPSVFSIRIVDEVAENLYFSEAVMKKIIWRIDEGKLFSEAFGESKFFPRVFINMLVVGEQTGRLSFIIDKLADLIDIDVAIFLENITSVLEPFLILIMGGLTFLILLGAFLPMYSIMKGL